MKNYLKLLLGLFSSITEVKEEKKMITDNIPQLAKETIWTNNPSKRRHNNRRNTKGRFVQYINIGNGKQRAIYHGAM